MVNRKRYAIKVDRLSFGYQKKDTCFSSASFGLKKGEKAILISGEHRGKSTLLRLLANLEKDYIGRIELLGESSNSLSKAYKNMVFLPENPVFFDNKSVKYNIEYAYNLLYENSKNMDYILNISPRLQDVLECKVKRLNVYQKTLLEVERASIKQIKLLLLDRSISDILKSVSGDEKQKKKVLDSVRLLYLDLIKNSESALVVCENKEEIYYYKMENAPVFYIYLGKVYRFENLEEFEKNIVELDAMKYLSGYKKRVVRLSCEDGKYYLSESVASSMIELKNLISKNIKKRKMIDKNMKYYIKTGEYEQKIANLPIVFKDKICLSKYPKFMEKLNSADVLQEEYFYLFKKTSRDKNLVTLSNLNFMLFTSSVGERVV